MYKFCLVIYVKKDCYRYNKKKDFFFVKEKNLKLLLFDDKEFWLILPVVICLSQRLSHACLSTHSRIVKPQKAQYISYGLLDRAQLHG